MTQLIYIYNDDLTFSHSETLDGNQEMPKNATSVAPTGYEPFKYVKDSDVWIGVSKEEWEKSHPSNQIPSETDQLKLMVGNLVAENAKKDQAIKQLQTMSGTLIAQVAELQKGSN